MNKSQSQVAYELRCAAKGYSILFEEFESLKDCNRPEYNRWMNAAQYHLNEMKSLEEELAVSKKQNTVQRLALFLWKSTFAKYESPAGIDTPAEFWKADVLKDLKEIRAALPDVA